MVVSMDDEIDTEASLEIVELIYEIVNDYCQDCLDNDIPIPKYEILMALQAVSLICGRHWGCETAKLNELWNKSVDCFTIKDDIEPNMVYDHSKN